MPKNHRERNYHNLRCEICGKATTDWVGIYTLPNGTKIEAHPSCFEKKHPEEKETK